MKKFLYDIKIEGTLLKEKNDDELNLRIHETKKKIETRFQDSSFDTNFTSEKEFGLLAKWFALTQEVSRRKIGFQHFETQLLAGFFLHYGKIVEMKTGEGKTLSSTLPVSFNALSGKGVHVVTVNDYLAERDQKWMGKVYEGLGLNVGLVKSTSSFSEKRKSYQKQITYVTNSELVFDYLRDSSALHLNEMVQRPFHYCVIDEIDSILIDEARTPLILSNSEGEMNINKLYVAKKLAEILEKEKDFQIDEKRKDINLTEIGYQKSREILGKTSLYEVNDPWILEILNALKAKYIFQLDKDYMILKNKVVIVDEFTGRIMEDRRWSMGIHEAVEVKENVKLGEGTKTKSSITYQNFFPLYPKLAGMTGTAKTAEKEFEEIYNLDVRVLETAKPMIRKDLPDLVYQSEFTKWKAVLTQSKKCFSIGQPILIGTASVEKSEFLSALFEASQIPHKILNAKPENVFRESEIVAQAGERFAVTIATNMAGRGTDIILGGNPNFQVKQLFIDIFLEGEELSSAEGQKEPKNSLFQRNKIEWFEKEFHMKEAEVNSIIRMIEEIRENTNIANKKYQQELKKNIKNLPYSLEQTPIVFQNLYKFFYEKLSEKWKKENEFVKTIGGLFVLGTERSETRRIDNQLRGRAGRQGDPGISQFFVSLEDDLMKVFGGEGIRKWIEYLMSDEDAPLESDILTKSLENAQKKLELYNYDIRKNVFQYDNLLNLQRKQFFQTRKKVLCDNISNTLFLRYAELHFDEQKLLEFNHIKNQKNLQNSRNSISILKNFDFYDETFEAPEQKDKLYSGIWIKKDLRYLELNSYGEKEFQIYQTLNFLGILDFYWTEHLERMTSIRETINWRSYGQQNPLTEYNLEAFQSFKQMLQEIRTCMLYYFLDNPILN
jgi:preprotein translocase subunit SecA